MKHITSQVLRRTYFSALGKTKIETKDGIVWADNNLTEEAHGAMTLVNIQLNEIGDTFVAYKDSTTLDGEGEDAKPIFLKGDTVTRKKQSMILCLLSRRIQAHSLLSVPLRLVLTCKSYCRNSQWFWLARLARLAH